MAPLLRPEKRVYRGFRAVFGADADGAGSPASDGDDGDHQSAVGAADSGPGGRDEAGGEGDEGIPDEAARQFDGGGDSSAEWSGGVL